MPSLTLDQVTQALDWLSLQRRGKGLSRGEQVVLMAVWDNLKYEEAAERSGFERGYLEGVASFELRAMIAQALNNGQPISKRYLRQLLEQHSTVLLGLLRHRASGELYSTATSTATKKPLEIIGGQPPVVPEFYGRAAELQELQLLLQEKNCVSVVGSAGIGKSALAAQLIEQCTPDLAGQFDYVVWKSIFYAPPLKELLGELNLLLSTYLKLEPSASQSLQEEFSQLISYLRSGRCLVVLDSAETLLQGNQTSFTPYGSQNAAFGQFLRRLAEEQLPSRLLILSRKPFQDINRFARSGKSTAQMLLRGLEHKDTQGFLRSRKIANQSSWDGLVSLVRGNPHLLTQAANRIQEFFGGEVKRFIRYSITLDPYFLEALDGEFGPAGSSTAGERWLVVHLADQIQQGVDPVPVSALLSAWQQQHRESKSMTELWAAIDVLTQAALVEKVQDSPEIHLSLVPLMKKYVVEQVDLGAYLAGHSR